jgi:hypothetical protein
MVKMTNAQAARLGYLAGKGAPFKSILADPQIGARGAQGLRNASTRWRLPMNGGNALPDENAGTLAVPIPPADRLTLEDAAAARGLSPESFAADLLHLVASEGFDRRGDG